MVACASGRYNSRMAARSEMPMPRVVDLRHVRAGDLDTLLEEEINAWERRLHWDFRSSADLVRRFVDMQALAGFALVQSNYVIGYIYYVCEERKGLIGDLYVLEDYRSVENENLLLHPVLDALFGTPFVKRVESQLMMIGQAFGRIVPLGNRAHVFERNFMEASLARVGSMAVKTLDSVLITPWSERHQDDAARVIAAAYEKHIDSRINDQYRSAAGARRFLLNIVQYPGCGTFFQPASFVSMDRTSGNLNGICLSSMVGPETGHITQICVSPQVRGTGIGYELLRRSMNALAEHGCTSASLTVTAANKEAIALYDRAGYEKIRSFAAYVWELG
jgi:ribosomal protein S18 acetylase RimI-like enzyme